LAVGNLVKSNQPDRYDKAGIICANGGSTMSWNMKGFLVGACNCDWGCPCSFNARPTNGFCEGAYVWNVTQGTYDGVSLAGLTFCWFASFPGPLHEGNGTAQVLIEAEATPAQRDAVLELAKGKRGGPFEIFAAVTGRQLDPIFAPFQVALDGLRSRINAAPYLEMEISPIENPVTGAHEKLRLQKPTGFTSTWADLGKSLKFHIAAPEIKYDHSGKYAEFSEFAYVEPAYAQPKGA
jgi:hypothetical protein